MWIEKNLIDIVFMAFALGCASGMLSVLVCVRMFSSTTESKEREETKKIEGFFVDKQYKMYWSCNKCEFRELQDDFEAVHGNTEGYCPECGKPEELVSIQGRYHNFLGDILMKEEWKYSLPKPEVATEILPKTDEKKAQ